MTMNVNAKIGDIQLPQPSHAGKATLAQALMQRKSIRELDAGRAIDDAIISDLLWSARGINRPDEGKLTSPTALNRQEIDVYLFDKTGVYLYDAANNRLVAKAEGDHRKLLAGAGGFVQDFVMDAPISLVMIADLDKFSDIGNAEQARLMGACDAGIVSQNINLYCAATGLATVSRATMDSKGIIELLGLSPGHLPILNNPVGYAK